MKSKKFNATAILLFMLITVSVLLVYTATANVYVEAESIGDEYDDVFQQVVLQVDIDAVEYSKEAIYDVDLNGMGYVYSYRDAHEQCGYVIIIKTDNDLKITEISTFGESPYADKKGKAVYISEFNYWDKRENAFVSLNNDRTEKNREELIEEFPRRYSAIGDNLLQENTTVNYVNKSESSYSVANRIPSYTYNKKNSACVPTAAGNIIAFYDRYKPNLIANYNPGNSIGTIYMYKTGNATIEGVIDTLYSDMNTDPSRGNTVDEFKTGFEIYCERRGYDVNYITCITGTTFNYAKAKNAIENDNMPVIMFVQSLKISDITRGEGNDNYFSLYGDIDHALSAFGYKEITYTQNDGSQRVVKFLHVASGIQRLPDAYLNIDNNLQIDDAYIIEIV